jgi:LPS-assembly protein
LRDYNRDLAEETITERASTLQLVKAWSDMTLVAELNTKQNVANDITLTADDGDNVMEDGEYTWVSRTISPLQALPRIDFSGRKNFGDSDWSAAWDSEYINYWRDRGLGAHRLDLHPQLITVLPRGGWWEGKLTGGLRETAYQVETYGDTTWAHNRFQDRLAWDFTGNVATTLMRDFDFSIGSFDWLEHTLRPNLIYEYLTRTQEEELPSFDGSDRLTMRNWLTFELNNYFGLGGVREDESLWSRNFGTLKILQTYDIREMRRNVTAAGDRHREWSDLRFELEIFPVESWKVRYHTNLSWYGKHVSRYELINELSLPGGHSISVDYQYLRNSGMAVPYFYTNSGDSRHDLEGRFATQLTDTLRMTGYLNKSFSTDHTVEEGIGFVYRPACWMVEAEMRRVPGDRSFMVIFSLDGIGRAFRWGKDNV